jgi:hypothetical protein
VIGLFCLCDRALLSLSVSVSVSVPVRVSWPVLVLVRVPIIRLNELSL